MAFATWTSPQSSESEISLNDNPQANSDWLLTKVLDLKRIRTDADKYFETYATMIYLEEAKQSQFLTQLNTENLQFEYSGGDEFRLRNNVTIE